MKPHIAEAIVVEGRYDKNTLSQTVEALIIDVGGFGLFKDSEKLTLIRRLAEKRGVIVLTDSDGAGFLIRGKIKSSVQSGRVLHAYIPDIPGRERRKRKPSAEGKLGVEGMEQAVLIKALRDCGATFDGEKCEQAQPLKKSDLCALGLSGGENSAKKRAVLLKRLSLPEHISSSALCQVLGALYEPDELEQILKNIEETE